MLKTIPARAVGATRPPAGPLALWRSELAHGARSMSQLDALWLAACWQAAAFDFPMGSRARLACHRRALDVLARAAAEVPRVAA